VALETMKMLDEEDYERMTALKGTYFLNGLHELKRRHRIIGDVDGMGLALRVEICGEDGFTPDKAMVDALVDAALKGDLEHGRKRYGLVLDIGGYYKNVITLAPALTISYGEIDLALALLDQLISRVSKS